MTPRQAREQLEQLREKAAKGKRFKTREQAMDHFYQLIPEMQRTGTRSTLADYY